MRVRPSRCADRNTNGRGQSASPLGPGAQAVGSNNRAYGHVKRSGHSFEPGQSGWQTRLRSTSPKAPRRRLPDLPSVKCRESMQRNRNRHAYREKSRPEADSAAIFTKSPRLQNRCFRAGRENGQIMNHDVAHPHATERCHKLDSRPQRRAYASASRSWLCPLYAL